MKDNSLEPNLTFIRQRAALLRELRAFFDSRGFVEVQPPCLATDCVVDAYLDPITVQASDLRVGEAMLSDLLYLQTSPESAMKRMLCSGAPSIYSVGPVFRSGEMGRHHNVEFTMLEWYQVDADLNCGVDFLGKLATHTLGISEFCVTTYRECFQHYLSLDPIEFPLQDLAGRTQEVANDQSLVESICDDRDAMLDVLMSQCIQPKLGAKQPVIVKDYPLSQAALAKRSSTDPQCAARFELFYQGVELANGYDELTDADELLRRAEQQNAKRAALGRGRLPVKTKLYQAMLDGLPDSCGVALGVDRLLMLQVGAENLQQVIPISIANC